MVSPIELMKCCGWSEVRSRKHSIWRCPCGKHQVSVSTTISDWRGMRNLLSDLKRLGCSSLSVAKKGKERKNDIKLCKM
jgi:hypothetical protein